CAAARSQLRGGDQRLLSHRHRYAVTIQQHEKLAAGVVGLALQTALVSVALRTQGVAARHSLPQAGDDGILIYIATIGFGHADSHAYRRFSIFLLLKREQGTETHSCKIGWGRSEVLAGRC